MSATPEQIAERLEMQAASVESTYGAIAGPTAKEFRAAAALIRAQAERVRVMESALRFYANEENYNDNGAPESGGVKAPTWSRHDFDLIQSELDYGKIARAALRGEA